MYGSIFWSATRYPRASRSAPMDAAASPLPSEDTTPPVTKMYFGATSSPPFLIGQPRTNIVDFRCPVDDARIQTRVTQRRERRRHRGPACHAERHHVVATQEGLHRPPPRHPPFPALARRAAREVQRSELRAARRAQDAARHARRGGREPARQRRCVDERAVERAQRLSAEPEASGHRLG